MFWFPSKALGETRKAIRNVKHKCFFFTPGLMVLSTAVSKATTLPSTWNPLVAPCILSDYIPLHPPHHYHFILVPYPSHSHRQTSLRVFRGHFVDILEGGGSLSSSVKVTHFLVIWYNNRKTAFSFTWKERCEQRGEEEEEEGWLLLRNWGSSLMREKRNQRKQATIAVFADANSLHLCSSCSKSSWV